MSFASTSKPPLMPAPKSLALWSTSEATRAVSRHTRPSPPTLQRASRVSAHCKEIRERSCIAPVLVSVPKQTRSLHGLQPAPRARRS